MSSFITPNKTLSSGTKPRTLQRPNIIRAFREGREREEERIRAEAAVRTARRRTAPAAPSCPNKKCPKPNVVDGTCQTCGRVADESNIVADVTFGETSAGAAIVQGTYIGAQQAGVRSMGPPFRGSSDEREKSIREARSLMLGYAQQLNLSENVVTSGVQAFKLASAANFIQGRTLPSVAAVCLYAACRNDPPCKVMLIDLADLVQVNVFKLGRTFKKLNEAVPICNEGLTPVYPEDLIWRFASKLEFQHMTAQVAEDAVRLIKRMSRDWMVMGRRPSGICGACLLMAARMHNFRRTVREVVYIVKVTTHTIQTRLEEFNATDSSRMTIEDFLKQDFLETSHDPPAFYRTTDEYKKTVEERKRGRLESMAKKRKREVSDDGEAERARIDAAFFGDGGLPRSIDSPADNPVVPQLPRPALPPIDLSSLPKIEFRRDDEGFIIPLTPSQIEAAAEINVVDGESAEAIDKLAQDYGEGSGSGRGAGGNGANDEANGADDADDADGDADADADTDASQRRRRGRSGLLLPVNDEWEADEAELEGQIDEIFNDPETYEHALAYGNAQQRARLHTEWALRHQPQVAVPDNSEIGGDEFADDPEVVHCCLTPEETRIKEMLWVNENKEWLRQQQERIFRRKMEADKPKQARKRKRRPRIGEGQTSPASTPGEAAVNVMKERAWSKRINYDAIRELFEPDIRGARSEIGSRNGDGSSRATSAAPDGDDVGSIASGQRRGLGVIREVDGESAQRGAQGKRPGEDGSTRDGRKEEGEGEEEDGDYADEEVPVDEDYDETGYGFEDENAGVPQYEDWDDEY